MVLYGGWNDLDCTVFINLTTRTASFPDFKRIPPSRRFHAGGVAGKSLIIYGGEDFGSEYLLDLQILDMNYMEWRTPVLKGIPVAISHAASCVVLSSLVNKTLNEYPLTELEDIPVKRGKGYPKYQGLYIFGGRNDHDLTNDMYVIRVSRRSFKLKKVNYKGTAPVKRMDTSLCFFKELNVLMLFGGVAAKGCLNDLFLFDLENITWIEIKIRGERILGRGQHVAQVRNEKLWILGGIKDTQYCSSDFLVMKLATKDFDTLVSDWIPKEKQSNREISRISVLNENSKFMELIQRKLTKNMTVQMRTID